MKLQYSYFFFHKRVSNNWTNFELNFILKLELIVSYDQIVLK